MLKFIEAVTCFCECISTFEKKKEMQHQDCDQENCKSSKLYLYLYFDAIISFAMFFEYIPPHFVCGQYNDFPPCKVSKCFYCN